MLHSEVCTPPCSTPRGSITSSSIFSPFYVLPRSGALTYTVVVLLLFAPELCKAGQRFDSLLFGSMDTDVPITVITMPFRGGNSISLYYKVRVQSPGTLQHRAFLVSWALADKMWRGYCRTSLQDGQNDGLTQPVMVANEDEMPGASSISFQALILQALERKMRLNSFMTSWIVTPSLYALWRFTSMVETELFADCFNHSDVLETYCSADLEDVQFGSRGTWESNEEIIEGGAANPPFEKDVINELLLKFERGTRRMTPFCRCALLPLSNRYKVMSHLNKLNSEGHLLVTIPPGGIPFQNEQVLVSGDRVKPKPNIYHTVGLFVWSNREYLMKNPPPQDVQEVYFVWTRYALCQSEKIDIHNEAFLRAFPLELRGEYCALDDFGTYLSN